METEGMMLSRLCLTEPYTDFPVICLYEGRVL